MLRVLCAVVVGVVGVVGVGAALKYETFRSPAVRLRSGQIANTPSTFGPLKFPEGPVAVRYFASRVVDDNGNNVSIAELYVHHWLIFDGGLNGGMCPNLHNIWGIGAELQNVIYEYPEPTAVVLSGNEQWSANLHFIRTSNVPEGGTLQDCIECRCPDSDPPSHPHGEVNCCKDQAQCYGMENSTLKDDKNYFLEYTIGYVPVTPDVVPLSVISLDVTSTQTTDCLLQYDVPGLAPGENHTMKNDNTLPSDWNISFVEMHLHVGGIHMQIDHYRANAFISTVCAADPVYITEGEGTGHLIDIPTCIFPDAYVAKKGDVLRITAVHSGRTIPGGNPWHAGVMGLAYIGAHVAPDSHHNCMQMLHQLCGSPIYHSGTECMNCASANIHQLTAANCTVDWIKAECAKNNDNGNIPAPDSVEGMSLHLTPTPSPNLFNLDLVCPLGVWCAIGFTWGAPVMENSTAFVYSDGGTAAGNGMVFQQRTLGNHNSGIVVNPNYPATITTQANTTELKFQVHVVVPSTANFERICFLFARGTGTTTLGYHGSQRGFECLTVQGGQFI